jgi:glycosyltransferase involved in cell wall biosynthesis
MRYETGMASPLHVGIAVLAGTTGGPATYGRRLVAALAVHRAELAVTVFTDAPELFAGFGCAVVHVPTRGGIDRLRWQHWALPRALRAVGPDVYHDTKNALPRALALPAVVTVHDLAYHRVPATFGRLSRWFLVRATADAARRARLVVVPSQATANDLAAIHPFAAARIRVVPHGIDAAPAVTPTQLAGARARLRLPEHYVLHVGTIQARKNVDLVIQAVRLLRQRGLPHRAVLVGRRGWLADKAMAEIARDDTALWLGDVGQADLAALHAGAAAFASPSAYEGFGLAVGDALAAGVPTVISDVSALPEIAGDAAVRVTTLTTVAIADALQPLLQDRARSAALATAGRARAAEFTWARSAAQHLAVYQAAALRV